MSSCADHKRDCPTSCKLYVDHKYIGLTDCQLLELFYDGDADAYDALVRQIFNNDVDFLRGCIRTILAESSTSGPDAEVVEDLLFGALATLWVKISDPNKKTVNPAKLKSQKLRSYLKQIAVRQTWKYKRKRAEEIEACRAAAEEKQRLRTDAETVLDVLVKDEDEEKLRCAWENKFGKKEHPALLQKVMNLAKEGLGCVRAGRELGIGRNKASHLKRKGVKILGEDMGIA